MRKVLSGLGCLRSRYARLPLFVQFIVTYLLILAIMFSAMILVGDRARQITMENYLSQRQYSLDTSANSFGRQITNFCKIPLLMNQSDHYREMRLAQEDSIESRHFYLLSKLCTSFWQQSFLLEIPNVSFLLFTRNSSIIAGNQFYMNAAECFSKHLCFADMGPTQAMGLLDDITTPALLPSHAISVNGAPEKQYLIYLYQYGTESALYGMLLEVEELLSLFRLQELPADTYFSIRDIKGNTLLAYNIPAETEQGGPQYSLLESGIASLGCSVTLGIPSSYFHELVRPINKLNFLYAIIAFIVGMFCSLMFTASHLRPVRQLLSISAKQDGERSVQNEYLALEQNIKHSMTENQRLTTQISHNKVLLCTTLLTRWMVQETYTNDDESLSDVYLPSLAGQCRILCLSLFISDESGTAASDYISYRMLDELTALVSAFGLLVQISHIQFALLVVDSEDALSAIREVSVAINDRMSLLGASVSAGVSDAFSGLGNLHRAYLHALFCMRYIDGNALSVFSRAPSAGKPETSLPFSDLHRFHNAVQAGEADQAQALLGTMIEGIHIQFERNENALQFLNAILLVLDSIREDMNLNLDADITRPPLPSHSFRVIQTDLEARTQAVLNARAEKNRDEYTSDFIERVLSYLRQHYGDSSLSTTSISDHFHVSKSYLYRAMKDIVGMTLTDKLEQIRMEKANELLHTTSMNIVDIATTCGYNTSNTFYKAFRKRYGVTPNMQRMRDSAEQ